MSSDTDRDRNPLHKRPGKRQRAARVFFAQMSLARQLLRKNTTSPDKPKD